MSKPLRLFIAVKVLSTPSLRKVLKHLETMGRPVKPVSADNLHVTLKFLGDTNPTRVPEISNAVSEAVDGEKTFEGQIVGLGAFPRIQRPSVIWAGLENGEPLKRIAESLETMLSGLNFHPEQKPFHPHLTLARIKSKPPPELAELLNENQTTDFGVVSISSVELFQSELQPNGPRYTVLASAKLTEHNS
ncbi:MAG: RNA 2',3'-cyclic phosphodiesterase [Planctomycetes bacterium]|nr:RNA 2',3'-cyclic phosphodiesterase [Planctomycetota bacterium]